MLFLILGQFFVGLNLIIFGIWYAWLIYKSPIDRTHVEVFWGVFGTLIGIVAAQVIIYAYYGYLPLWGILWGPVAFGLTGVPQLIFQEIKFRAMKKEAGDLKNNRHSDGEKKE